MNTLASIPNNVFLGTSGWSYNEWIGPFYTKVDKSKLRAYSKVFQTVEIDSTFYRYPSKGTVMGWTRYSPEGFVYSAKLPGLITHDKKLGLNEGIEQDLDRFVQLMEPLFLSGKLACILVQLPPKFDYRPQELESFFKILPKQVRFAVEFREKSWMRSETWSLLEKYNVAYTIVDEPLLPPEVHLTSDIAYFRWHGHGQRPWYDYRYSPRELDSWIPKVTDVSKRVGKVFGYFNNHYHGYAVENCLQVMQMLGNINAKQADAKSKVEEYLQSSTKPKNSTLESFVEPRNMSFESLIRYFVPSERLQRAEKIDDNELIILEQEATRIYATIRDYYIVINAEATIISHDCPDWEKTLPTKKLCKHVAKLLLSLDRKRATEILRKMYSEQDKWRFTQYKGE
jgi:uncharacterized protein YecE (DUF72 family)